MIHRTLATIQEEMALGLLRIDDAVVELADASRLGDIAALLEARLAMSQAALKAVLDACEERPAALLCRAAGLSVNGYSAVLRMRRRTRPSALAGPTELLQAYLGLDKLQCAEAVRRWQADPDLEDA